MQDQDPPIIDDPQAFGPELNAVVSVLLMYWKFEAHVETKRKEDVLNKVEALSLIMLTRPRRLGALAQLMSALPSTVTAAAANLEQRGLIQRFRDPDDGRAWLIELTDAGREKRAEMQEGAAQVFRQISGLSAPEIEVFGQLCAKIRANISRDDISSLETE